MLYLLWCSRVRGAPRSFNLISLFYIRSMWTLERFPYLAQQVIVLSDRAETWLRQYETNSSAFSIVKNIRTLPLGQTVASWLKSLSCLSWPVGRHSFQDVDANTWHIFVDYRAMLYKRKLNLYIYIFILNNIMTLIFSCFLEII